MRSNIRCLNQVNQIDIDEHTNSQMKVKTRTFVNSMDWSQATVNSTMVTVQAEVTDIGRFMNTLQTSVPSGHP